MAISAFVAVVACGPSAEEQKAMEQKKQDSIAAAQKMIDDSMAAVNAAAEASEKAMADSMAAVAAKAAADSVAAAEAAAKKAKPASKPKPKEKAPVKPEDVKPGQGRG
ncbi:MAG: hypothetical protein RIQ89_2071 [Bacteroidota bacterium]